MLKVSIIEPYDNTEIIKTVSVVNLEAKSIDTINLSNLALNEPYLADVQLSVNSKYWENFKNRNIGIRITTDYVDLAFMKLDRKTDEFATHNVRLIGSMAKLYYSVSYPDQYYNGSLTTFLSNIASDSFVFTPISGDKNIEINTGVQKDFYIVEEAIKKAGWNFRENGLVTSSGVTKTQILYGDFGEDIVTWYEADTANRQYAKPSTISKVGLLPNWRDENSAELGYIHENESGTDYSYLVGFLSPDGANNPNTRIFLDPNQITQDDQFPIIEITKNGTTYYAVQNPYVPFYPIKEEWHTFDSVTNTQDNTGSQEASPTTSPQQLYSLCVAKIKSDIVQTNITFSERNLKRLTLPGNVVYLNYKRSLERVDGSKFTVFDYQNESMVMDRLSFDLNQIKN